MEVEVTFLDGTKGQVSYQQKLIMIHSPSISAQWNPDGVGVQLVGTDEYVSVGLHITSCNFGHYQNFFFKPENYEALKGFFKTLRFPEQCFSRLNTNKNTD